MSFWSKLFSKSKPEIEAPEGACPNCWGRQEYQDKIFEAVRKKGIDIKKLELEKGWIRAYAMENLSKLWLEDRDGASTCPTCHVEYKEIK